MEKTSIKEEVIKKFVERANKQRKRTGRRYKHSSTFNQPQTVKQDWKEIEVEVIETILDQRKGKPNYNPFPSFSTSQLRENK